MTTEETRDLLADSGLVTDTVINWDQKSPAPIGILFHELALSLAPDPERDPPETIIGERVSFN